MSSSVSFHINVDCDKSLFDYPSGSPKEFCQFMETFFSAVNGGLYPASVEKISSTTDFARASATLTVASINANDTCVINGVTLTAKASPSGASEFLSTGSNTVVAAAVAACINAHSSFTGICYATSSNAVVTVYAYQKGKIGNAITLLGTATRFAESATRLAGGTGADTTPVSYALGK